MEAFRIFLHKFFCNEKLSHFGTFQPSLCRTILQKKPIDRSPTDLLNISKMLTTINFFKQLDADTIQKLGRVLVLQEFDPGVPIFVQGEPGEDFYIILLSRRLLTCCLYRVRGGLCSLFFNHTAPLYPPHLSSFTMLFWTPNRPRKSTLTLATTFHSRGQLWLAV
jgi:hypothetical protein